MVRLEGLNPNSQASITLSFNSYMVRLEETTDPITTLENVVSIPIWCDWKLNPSYLDRSRPQFQFLYGAIGSWKVVKSPSATTKFQFLYGAIGSTEVKRLREKQVCFNSYMVRLEVSSQDEATRRQLCFNSYMVRLEDHLPNIIDFVNNVFQFLYGAIGSPPTKT